VKTVAQRVPGSVFWVLGSAWTVIRRASLFVLLIVLSASFFSWVWIYASALRDPRYLDGWVLAAGMSLQFSFHAAVKTNKLQPKLLKRWRGVHIYVGYALVAAFLSHSNFSMPDTPLEWALWSGFVTVTLSGVFGTYLAWSSRAKGGIDDNISLERILARRADLARDVRELISTPNQIAVELSLPAPPYDAWITDLYANHLNHFFAEPRNFSSHLFGSRRPLQRLTAEIERLSRYVDGPRQDKLATISKMTAEKDRLDFARVHLALTRAWLFVHVPITYALLVLSALHILVVYSYSSGAW
jgi:hypothetical protein